MKRFLLAILIFAAPVFATVNDASNGRTVLTGNGATTSFTFVFPAVSASNITATVKLGALAQSAPYSVVLNSDQINSPGGVVTFTTAPANTTTITIQRQEVITQGTSLPPFSPFPAKTVEKALDSTIRKVQQVDRRVGDLEIKEAADISNTIAGGVAAANLLAPIATGSTTGITLADFQATDFDVRSFGATTAAGDNQAAFQAAVSAACSLGKAVHIPGGHWNIGSTITGCGSIRIYGDGDTSIIVPTITNGTAVINFPPASGHFKLENFKIDSGVSIANFDAGSQQAQQCTGVQVTSTITTGPFSSRFSMTNIHVIGVKVAFDIHGHIFTAENLWAQANEIGFKCIEDCNAYDLNLRLEDNRQDFSIGTGGASAAIMFRNLLMEGANTLGVASTIDNVSGVSFYNSYFEGSATAPRANPWMIVGGSTLVTSFNMIGGNVVGSGGMQTGVYPIKLDNVNGAYIQARFADGSQMRKVLTTSNTKDYRLASNADFDYFSDESKQLGTVFNYWPNPSFEMWLKGFNDVQVTRSTFTKETTIVRRGNNALRVSATAGQNFNHTDLHLTGSVVTALRGKSVRFGLWMWVPAITEYADVGRVSFPNFTAESFNGVTLVQVSPNNVSIASNAWNYLYVTLSVQSDATRLGFDILANNSGTNATGNEFVVVDDLSVTEDNAPISRQMIGDYVESVLVPARGINGVLQTTGTAAPTDVNQTYTVGDIVWNTSVAAGGSPGWVCTTGGSPGTWKTMATVAP